MEPLNTLWKNKSSLKFVSSNKFLWKKFYDFEPPKLDSSPSLLNPSPSDGILAGLALPFSVFGEDISLHENMSRGQKTKEILVKTKLNELKIVRNEFHLESKLKLIT
jgi:hypothetical protein